VAETDQKALTDSASLHREKARLRLIGIIVLVLGLSIAGLVYWRGTRSADARVEQYEQAQARAESRQMQMLYGTSGGLMEDFLNALKRPGNQALIIAAITGLIAGGCFYLGRPLPEVEEPQ
jgi:predicted TIM-barrel enzyme